MKLKKTLEWYFTNQPAAAAAAYYVCVGCRDQCDDIN